MEKKVNNRIIESIFFSNFFLILLSIALNIETNIKIGLPLNSVWYYIFISSISVLFYLYAYRIPKYLTKTTNPRTQFYVVHQKSIQIFTFLLLVLSVITGIILVIKSIPNLEILSWKWIAVLFFTVALAFSYYDFKIGLSLRKKMWLKPFLIGWTWAITTVFLPVLCLMLENKVIYHLDAKFYFLFSQTFMYCVVNAILFDLKDFEDDSNRNLKTFVVKYGYHFTLNRIILPLIFLGFLSFVFFGFWYGLPLHRILFMLIPIICLAIFSFKLNQPKSILYYLIAIDGMILFKAICGILSVVLFE
jgi:4-hydroxybenzoate polyprenyltransferase